MTYREANVQVIACFWGFGQTEGLDLGCAFGGRRGGEFADFSPYDFYVIRGSATSFWLVTITKLAVKYRAAERYNDFVPSAIFKKNTNVSPTV